MADVPGFYSVDKFGADSGTPHLYFNSGGTVGPDPIFKKHVQVATAPCMCVGGFLAGGGARGEQNAEVLYLVRPRRLGVFLERGSSVRVAGNVAPFELVEIETITPGLS